MPSPRPALAWLLVKETRELLASRAWWLFLVLMGPLVGVSFISAVRTYGELSGVNGSSAGVGEAFSPLIGIWAPTFSACELAAAFLLPFVAIRLVAGDRQNGTLQLEMQHRFSSFTRIGAKAIVLLGGWIAASTAVVIALVLWTSYGGTLSAPEIGAVVLGHVLNAGLTIGLATAAAGVTEHPSTAAIATLSVTVGTWVLSFVAAVHGGVWERAAEYTPTAMVAAFQHGLVRLDVVLVALVLIAAMLALGATWLRLGLPVGRRAAESALIVVVVLIAIGGCGRVRASWDLSENRANSFRRSDEEALRQLRQPLVIEAHLAAEDPRRADLERRSFAKLRRLLPNVNVRYVSHTAVGIFEQSRPGYGEVWYGYAGRRLMSRATTPEGVLEAIYEVSSIAPSPEDAADVFRGHPLAVTPSGAAVIFYGVWPVITVALSIASRLYV